MHTSCARIRIRGVCRGLCRFHGLCQGATHAQYVDLNPKEELNLPAYTVAVKNAKDVAVALRFAKAHNLQAKKRALARILIRFTRARLRAYRRLHAPRHTEVATFAS